MNVHDSLRHNQNVLIFLIRFYVDVSDLTCSNFSYEIKFFSRVQKTFFFVLKSMSRRFLISKYFFFLSKKGAEER